MRLRTLTQPALRGSKQSRVNDQAYFVLCWGQLEAEIDQACREAIRRHRNDTSWSVRRAWDLYNPDDKRISGLSFEDRTALVVDHGAGPGSIWAKIIRLLCLTQSDCTRTFAAGTN